MPYISLTFILTAVFVVHAAKTGRFWPWAYVILFLPVVGALAYVAVELAPEWLGSHKGRQARASLDAKLNPGRRLRELRENLETADTIGNRGDLAEELLARGEYQEALTHYQHILALPNGPAPGYFLGAARAQLGLNDPSAAIATLEEFRKEYPDSKNGDAHLLYATALDAANRTDEALHEYEDVSRSYAGAEPRARRAALLMRLGRADEARAAASDVVRSIERSPGFAKKAQAEWLAMAKKIAKG